MDSLIKILDGLIGQLKTYVANKNVATDAGNKLFQTALTFIGKDASPLNQADSEYACAESVNFVNQTAFGEPIGGGTSTYLLYISLKNHKKFVQVTNPLLGDIIIYPTGTRLSPSPVDNGHCGILLDNNRVGSNNSATGLFDVHYDLWSIRYRYKTIGHYPEYIFRRVLAWCHSLVGYSRKRLILSSVRSVIVSARLNS